MIECLIVGAGGCLGAVLRYLITLTSLGGQGGFPFKTFLINLLGSFVIGCVVALSARGGLGDRWTLFLKVGVCGGFTTFSSFALESDQLMAQGAWGMAAAYVCASVAGGVAMVVLAQRLLA